MPFFKGTGNVWPNDTARRARRSPTNKTIIQKKAAYTAGQSFNFEDITGDPIEVDTLSPQIKMFLKSVDGKRTSLRKLYKAYSLNFIELGNCFVQVKTNRGVRSFFNHDATDVRVSKDGKVGYISQFWRDIGEQTTPGDCPVETVEMWNGKVDTKQSNFLIHFKQKAIEFETYGLIDYIGALDWTDIEYQIAKYNKERFDRDFMLSGVGTMSGEPPEGMTAEKYLKGVNDKLSGEGNRGKVLLQLVDDTNSQKFIWEPMSQIRDGEFQELKDLAKECIITGHSWSIYLLGAAVTGGISSNDKILEAWQEAMNTLVIPMYQEPMLELTDLIVQLAGFDFTVGINNKPPIKPDVDFTQISTINEQREVVGLPPDETGKGEEYLSKTVTNIQTPEDNDAD